MVSNKTFRNYSLKKKYRKAKGSYKSLKKNINYQQQGGVYGQQVIGNDDNAKKAIFIPKSCSRVFPPSEPNPPLSKVLKGGSAQGIKLNSFLGGADGEEADSRADEEAAADAAPAVPAPAAADDEEEISIGDTVPIQLIHDDSNKIKDLENKVELTNNVVTGIKATVQQILEKDQYNSQNIEEIKKIVTGLGAKLPTLINNQKSTPKPAEPAVSSAAEAEREAAAADTGAKKKTVAPAPIVAEEAEEATEAAKAAPAAVATEPEEAAPVVTGSPATETAAPAEKGGRKKKNRKKSKKKRKQKGGSKKKRTKRRSKK